MVRSRAALAASLALCASFTAARLDAGWWSDRIHVTALDAVTTPRAAVDVRAKFERQLVSYWRPDLGRKAATIEVPGARLAATTDSSGYAEVGVTPARTGVFPFSAWLVQEPGRRGQGRLFVIDPSRPVAVVDIDQTLSDMPSWEVPFRGHRADTYPDAPQVMAEVARRYAVIYLTARDEGLQSSSRAFLARHGFGDGALLMNDLGLRTAEQRRQIRSHNHGDFKLAVIRGLQARGVNVVMGIGNAETDAYAYEQAGLQSFIQTTVAGTGPSYRFGSWAELRLELIARGLLP